MEDEGVSECGMSAGLPHEAEVAYEHERDQHGYEHEHDLGYDRERELGYEDQKSYIGGQEHDREIGFINSEPALQEFLPHQLEENTPPPPGRNQSFLSVFFMVLQQMSNRRLTKRTII